MLVLSNIMTDFKSIAKQEHIYLYAGDMPMNRRQNHPFIGLSLNQHNNYHIKHDMTKPLELPDNCVDIFQSEDVFEHIEYELLPDVLNEIFRVLKPRGLFRLSMPDYKCDILLNRSTKDANGNIIFDIDGGGSYDKINETVVGGGHVWFPTYKSVDNLIQQTNFDMQKVHFLHYYSQTSGLGVCNDIDYSLGLVQRTPDNDKRVQNPRRPMSIVIDMYK